MPLSDSSIHLSDSSIHLSDSSMHLSDKWVHLKGITVNSSIDFSGRCMVLIYLNNIFCLSLNKISSMRVIVNKTCTSALY